VIGLDRPNVRRHQMQASPNDHAGHPILVDMEVIVQWGIAGVDVAAGVNDGPNFEQFSTF
jgi:hypothetical protein